MKDAFGSTFMMYAFIVFLATFVIFIGIAFTFARAFRVKNMVIDIIEQNEGFDPVDTSGVQSEIDGMLGQINYYVDCSKHYNEEARCYGRGYLVEPHELVTTNGVNVTYYSVTTFASISVPLLNLSIDIPIKGETRKVERIM